MKKTGVKTFMISFTATLFVIFTINGLCVRERKEIDKKHASSKNISLFFKKNYETGSASVIPIRKIALSVPEEEMFIAKTDNIENIPLDLKEINDEIKISSIEDLFEYEDDSNTIEKKEIVIENFEELKNSKPPIENKDIIIAQNETSQSINKETILAELLPEKFAENDSDDAFTIPLEKNSHNNKDLPKTTMGSMEKTNQVAMNSTGADIKSMASDGIDMEDSEFDNPTQEVEWKTMKDTKKEVQPSEGDPWIVAKGVKHPKNKLILEQEYSKEKSDAEIRQILSGAKEVRKEEEVIVSADMVKNIIIPIPKDIMDQDNLTPQLVVGDEKEVVPEVGVSNNETAPVHRIEEATKEEKDGFFSSLKNIFSNAETAEDTAGLSEFDGVDDELYSKLKKNREITGTTSVGGVKRTNKILPTEMRLAFQPNRAEISGQTLKWVHAFANKVNEELGLVLEVRIDRNSGTELQQKRLNLLSNILANKGLSSQKVNIIFTSREPNSFVIRAVKMSETRDKLLMKKAMEKRTTPYYLQGRNVTPDNYQQW